MSKKDASKLDAIACAQRCDAQAEQCKEAFPSVAEQLTEAAAMIRALHRVVSEVDCLHVITYTVTKDMHDKGVDKREPGKYCMTCGTRIEQPTKAKKKKTKAHVEVDDDDGEEESAS